MSKTNSSMVQNLKKLHDMTSVEKKDISLKDLVAAAGKQCIISVTGFASKLVPKYTSNENRGYHTMVYTVNADGEEIKTGAFSNALYDFAGFFYKCAGLDTTADFNKIIFDKPVDVEISVVKLDGGKTTYNFDIVGGEMQQFEKFSTQQLAAGIETKSLPSAE